MHPKEPIEASDLEMFERHRAVAVVRLLQFGRDLLQVEAASPERHETVEKLLWQRLHDALEDFLSGECRRFASLLCLLRVDIGLEFGMRSDQAEVGHFRGSDDGQQRVRNRREQCKDARRPEPQEVPAV